MNSITAQTHATLDGVIDAPPADALLPYMSDAGRQGALDLALDETERALARTVAGCDVTALAELPAYLELAIDVPGVEIGAPAVGTIEVALRSVAHQTK